MSTSDTTSKVGMRSRYLDRLQGSVPERPKGADCKSAGTAFGGSNPPRPTSRSQSQPGAAAGAGSRPWSGALSEVACDDGEPLRVQSTKARHTEWSTSPSDEAGTVNTRAFPLRSNMPGYLTNPDGVSR